LKPSLSIWMFVLAAIVMSPHMEKASATTISAWLIGLASFGLTVKLAWWFFITRKEKR